MGTQQSCQVWGRWVVESGRWPRGRGKGLVISLGSLSVLNKWLQNKSCSAHSLCSPPFSGKYLFVHISFCEFSRGCGALHPLILSLLSSHTLYSLLVHSQICFLSTFSSFSSLSLPIFTRIFACPFLSATLSFSIPFCLSPFIF